MPPSHASPLQVAPLSSIDSSDVSLLDDYDSSKPQTRVSYGGSRRLSITVIIPGILIFIACAGLASSLLAWLQSRRIESHISREDQYFRNALVAIEGATAPHKLDDGSLESDTTMYGLAISAVSGQVVSLTVPFLLGLLGYRLASMWILAQEKERTGSMPTAAQYGLLVKLCGSANIFSTYETVKYLKRGREQRSQAPSTLIFAFVVLVVAIVLNHLLSAADLWLHTTASTFIHTSMTEIAAESMPTMGTKINLTACPGPTLVSLSDIKYYSNCARVISVYDHGSGSIAPQWGDADMITEGLAVVGNSSSTSRSVMLDNMAVLVPSTMPGNVDNLTFNSFGLIADCQPVVDCLVDNSPGSFYCPSFNPPYNVSTSGISASSDSTIEMLNLTTNALSRDIYGGYPLDSVLNPFGARVLLYWNSFDAQRVFPADNSPGWYPISGGMNYAYMGTCSITAYNVSLSYSTLDGNNTYAFADYPVLSNFNTTSAVFAALDIYYVPNLVDYLKRILRFSVTLSTKEFNTVLSQNIAYAAMGLASPLFERDVSTGGNAILLRSASRYPLAPLSAVLAILYTYAFLALAITASSMVSSREIVFTKSSGKERRITTIELIQLRLTNPLANIAERFSDPARPELLLESSAVDMFHEHPHAEKLGVVIADDEGEEGEGIIRKRRTFGVESVERRLTELPGSTLNITSDREFSLKEIEESGLRR
ncbi:hypothetical protein IW261DRAFT_826521 [Armillaria novae-zelandiae]|uniref:Uncharacterized protein n=1 Tax=Armillaria novae-zelandiae TaxID=153914 RepID=A0AA39NUX1_9AGAR|nr:hypothetical protein IW261DRAFT_826521 [Armillaria novae-zelandiae]